MGIELRPYQLEAVKRMRNGCILCGGVGSGKSRTALAYYFMENGGDINPKKYIPKGTKFLVAFVGGNLNNCQIIGRCYE